MANTVQKIRLSSSRDIPFNKLVLNRMIGIAMLGKTKRSKRPGSPKRRKPVTNSSREIVRERAAVAAD